MSTPGAEELAAQERALTEAVGAVVLDRDVVTVSGPDTEWFLQGQLSQDVAALAVGQSAWSLLLQPQGKVDAWLRVNRIAADRFVLDVDAGWAGAVQTRLARYRLRTKVEFETATWSVVALRGPGTADAVATPARDVIVAPAQWPGVDGVDLLAPQADPPAGVLVCSVDALEAVRIAAGVPAMGAELTEDTIPAEALVVERSASFTKGCYTGQELVARIDSRGSNTPRRLRAVVGAALAAGDELVVDGAVVGVVSSAARSELRDATIGLALVKRSVDPADGPVAAVAGPTSVPVQVHQVPLAPLVPAR